MDPNETLHEIRELLVLLAEQRVDDKITAHWGRLLAVQVDALDNWMSKGGFLPDAWRDHR